MKQVKSIYLLIALVSILLVQACHKQEIAPVAVKKADTVAKIPPVAAHDTTPVSPPFVGLSVKLTSGVYVLNKGGYPTGGSLTFYEFSTKKVYPDLYNSVNGLHIITGGNDMELGGAKLYFYSANGFIALNASTGKLIKKDSSQNAGFAVTFFNSKVLVGTGGINVNVEDTSSFAVSSFFSAGTGSDYISHMAMVNNKLYAADGNTEGSSVSVIDPITFSIIKKIGIGAGPYSFTADNLGDLYVIGSDDSFHGDSNPPAINIIDTKADTVKRYFTVNIKNGQIYAQGNFVYYPTADGSIAMFNATTQAAERANFITDGTTLINPVALTGNPATGEIFVSDVKDGKANGVLYAFDQTGKLEYSFATGVNPYRIVLLK